MDIDFEVNAWSDYHYNNTRSHQLGESDHPQLSRIDYFDEPKADIHEEAVNVDMITQSLQMTSVSGTIRNFDHGTIRNFDHGTIRNYDHGTIRNYCLRKNTSDDLGKKDNIKLIKNDSSIKKNVPETKDTFETEANFPSTSKSEARSCIEKKELWNDVLQKSNLNVNCPEFISKSGQIDHFPPLPPVKCGVKYTQKELKSEKTAVKNKNFKVNYNTSLGQRSKNQIVDCPKLFPNNKEIDTSFSNVHPNQNLGKSDVQQAVEYTKEVDCDKNIFVKENGKHDANYHEMQPDQSHVQNHSPLLSSNDQSAVDSNISEISKLVHVTKDVSLKNKKKRNNVAMASISSINQANVAHHNVLIESKKNTFKLLKPDYFSIPVSQMQVAGNVTEHEDLNEAASNKLTVIETVQPSPLIAPIDDEPVQESLSDVERVLETESLTDSPVPKSIYQLKANDNPRDLIEDMLPKQKVFAWLNGMKSAEYHPECSVTPLKNNLNKKKQLLFETKDFAFVDKKYCAVSSSESKEPPAMFKQELSQPSKPKVVKEYQPSEKFSKIYENLKKIALNKTS